jgi:iron(II)-dependent oxidoreductase
MASPPLTDALAEGRARTMALVEPLSDADVETQHTEIMSPLVWDLAHIAAYEELWLVHRHAGEPLSQPERSAMYDAFETPRAVRGDLPLLDRDQALDYLEDVRRRVPGGESFIHELVLRHEHQHGETMLQAIELARLGPPPARASSGQATRASPTTTSARAIAPSCPRSGSAARRSPTPRS